MASIKYSEPVCPYCGHSVPALPHGKVSSNRRGIFGDPHCKCKKCGKIYRSVFITEAAEGLTLAEQVPFWNRDTHLLVVETVLATMLLVVGFMEPELFLLALIGLPVLFLIHTLISYCTISHRQKQKDEVLLASRERMQDPKYFTQYLAGKLSYEQVRDMDPLVLILLHRKAMTMMEQDQAVNLEEILKNPI